MWMAYLGLSLLLGLGAAAGGWRTGGVLAGSAGGGVMMGAVLVGVFGVGGRPAALRRRQLVRPPIKAASYRQPRTRRGTGHGPR